MASILGAQQAQQSPSSGDLSWLTHGGSGADTIFAAQSGAGTSQPSHQATPFTGVASSAGALGSQSAALFASAGNATLHGAQSKAGSTQASDIPALFAGQDSVAGGSDVTPKGWLPTAPPQGGQVVGLSDDVKVTFSDLSSVPHPSSVIPKISPHG